MRILSSMLVGLLALAGPVGRADSCRALQVGPDQMPGRFSLIGQVFDAKAADMRPVGDCDDSDVCVFVDGNGFEFGTLRESDGSLVTTAITVFSRSNKSVQLPFGLVFNDLPWQIVKKLLRASREFPALGIYRRATGEIVISTGNCLRFPNGEEGGFDIWIGEDDRIIQVQLAVPWEGE